MKAPLRASLHVVGALVLGLCTGHLRTTEDRCIGASRLLFLFVTFCVLSGWGVNGLVFGRRSEVLVVWRRLDDDMGVMHMFSRLRAASAHGWRCKRSLQRRVECVSPHNT